MEVKFWYGKEVRRKDGSVIFVSIRSNTLTIKKPVNCGNTLPNGAKSFPAGSLATAPVTNGN